jgi:hypothetical protein
LKLYLSHPVPKSTQSESKTLIKGLPFETHPGSNRKFSGKDKYKERVPKQNSKASVSMRNNELTAQHQSKELLHSK